MIFAVLMLMSTAAIFAADFGFLKVETVKQTNNGFVAVAAGENVAISASQYKRMSGVDGYYVISVAGRKIVAASDEFVVEVMRVDYIGFAEDNKPEVYFDNGTTKVFKTNDWLLAQQKQQVRRVYINTPSLEFENYATVKSGETVQTHSKVAPVKEKPTAVVSAPIKAKPVPVVSTPKVKPAEMETIKVEPAKIEVIPAEPEKVETAEKPAQSGAFPMISFSIKH